MYEIVRSQDRYLFQNEWLSAYWHFSFDHYYDPRHVQFGPLRVFNNDRIQPKAGFPTHSHQEMEIVTYVIDGQLAHKDSTGGIGTIGPGEVQHMSAGTGIQHSEYNASDKEEVHLLQMWFLPATPNLEPGYEQKSFTREQREGTLLPIVSGADHPGALEIHQDATLYVGRIRTQDKLTFETTSNRQTYFFVMSGHIQLGKHTFKTGDSAKISEETVLPLVAQATSEILLIDLP
ncbi:MAG: pirin family protein [Acidobacteriota bacterium]